MFGFDLPIWAIAFGLKAKGIFSAIVTFCSKPPGSWIACAIGVVLGLWWFGQHEFNKGVQWQLAQDADAAANINAGQPKIIERLRTVYLPAETKIKIVTKAIIKEVPVYVTKRDDSACVINNGFVHVHDAAANGELPGGPTGTDGDASPVKLSTVAETVT